MKIIKNISLITMGKARNRTDYRDDSDEAKDCVLS